MKYTKTSIGIVTGLTLVLLSMTLNSAFTTSVSNLNPDCMTQKDVSTITLFGVKEPHSLPSNYKFQCGIAGIHEAYLLYGTSTIPPGTNESLKSIFGQQAEQGSIYLTIIDEKGILGDANFTIEVGNTSKRITDEYNYIIQKNPSLHPELIKINGVTAWANEACLGCGKQTAYFHDGTILHHSYDVPSRIQFYDKNGIMYNLQSNVSLYSLKQIAESMR